MLKAICVAASVVLGIGAIANGTFMLIVPSAGTSRCPA